MELSGFSNLARYPRLDTMLMVEKFIRKHSGEYKKRKLWESLPKKMMYQTYCTIIDYLEYSGKIAFDKERIIGWIYNPALFNKYINREDLSWRKENAKDIKNKVRRQKNKSSISRVSNRKNHGEKSLQIPA